MASTLYDHFKDKYVRARMDNSALTGLLNFIDCDTLVMRPHLQLVDTPFTDRLIVSDTELRVTYNFIRGMQEISNGRNYIETIQKQSAMKAKLDLRMRLKDAKKKGISDPELETELQRLIDEIKF